jgi:membrane protein implicated in regulation of membrane protease activity
MNMPELDWPLMVALVAVVLTVVAWVSAASLNRRLGVQQREAEQRCQALEQRLEWLQQSISGLTSGAVGMDRRVQRIEARGKVLAERQETYENQQID